MSPELTIILGYITFFLYMALLMGVGELLCKKTNLPKELIRKSQHILTSLSWLIGVLFFGPTIHIVIINFLGFILLTIATFTNILSSSERSDSKKSYGLMFFGLGTFLVILYVVYFEESLFLVTGIPYYCLTLADGLAPIIAKLCKKINTEIIKGKTLIGTLTVFIVSLTIIVLFNQILSLNYSLLFIIGLASLCTILELFGYKGSDNLYIEIGMFGLILLNHYNLTTTPFLIAIILAPVVIIYSLKKKILTLPASLWACILSFSLSFFSGLPLFLTMIILFVLSIVTNKISRQITKEETTKEIRKLKQIACVSIVTIIASVIYYFTKNEVFNYIAFATIIEQFLDSLASDIGRLSKGEPYDLFKGKIAKKGDSGAVSLLGLSSSFVAAILVTLPIGFSYDFNFGILIIIAFASFLGTIFDSLFGSLLQAKFQCLVCNSNTEQINCCGQKGKKISGISFIDNQTVNLLSSITTAIITYLIFIIL